ncbi:ThiF family adenylyltransferase [Streptomyces sp. NPDC056222]|uniref:ThiF family adenylyltransferase n=1 Tax=Streptomyces sp. NPDC056222 TaxID=3345749 RepID=UPI0035DB1197
MHPMLKPALRRAWRNLQSVQFGATPAHAVVLGPVDTATGSLLGLLDGTRGMERLRDEARALGLPDGVLERLLGRLAEAGLIADGAAGRPGKAGGATPVNSTLDPLRADLASLSVIHREPDGALRRLAARRALRVQVRGAGRVGAAVAALLSASGVGRVEVLDSGSVEPWEVSPGGLPPDAVGERRAVAARRLVARSAPGGRGPRAPRREPGESGHEPGLSLVVVTPRDGLAAYLPDPVTAESWIMTGVPHLYAGVLEATGVVGPLVLPGATACAGCMQETRTDREPVWPRMLAQWRSGAPHALPACDLGLATAVAGLAASHALAFLDGELPACAGARFEASLPLLEWREERMRPHPACSCGAVRRGEGEHDAGVPTPHDTMAG